MDREDLITGYIEGSLGEADLLIFEQLLLNDPDFAGEVRFRQELRQAIQAGERERLKDQFRAFERERAVAGEVPVRRISVLSRWIAIAATVVLVGMASLWWYSSIHSVDRLYNTYFETFPNMVQPLVRGVEAPTAGRSEAFRAYDSGDYQEAARLFSGSANAEELFYQALSEMQLGKHQNAAVVFEEIVLADTDLKPYIQWYRALNLLKLGRPGEAKTLLDGLGADPDFDLREQAAELKKSLD